MTETPTYPGATDDLRGVPDHPPLPQTGWHEGFVSYVGTKPSKAGAMMRTACIFVKAVNGDDYRAFSCFVIGPRPGMEKDEEEIGRCQQNLRDYKTFVKCCGFDPDKDAVNTDDLAKSSLLIHCTTDETAASFPVQVDNYRPAGPVPGTEGDRDINADAPPPAAPPAADEDDLPF